eukprot:scaffold648525_cov47-Prasinocladus_malaysianus.AAC.1
MQDARDIEAFKSDLEWLSCFAEPCGVWEKNLEHIANSHAACMEHYTKLAAAHQLVANIGNHP